MATATYTKMGYRATKTDKALIVHDVEIFCACKRDDFNADERWVKAAVKKAMADARGGYFPPLHIHHHEPGAPETDAARRAGYFEITGVRPITLDGKRRNAVFADLHIKDSWAQEEVLSELVPYRSVEIFDVTEPPSIDGLALLDHEAPYLRLPMMMNLSVADEAGGVADATFSQPWSMSTADDDGPLVAFFRRGNKATLLFRAENAMATKIEEKPETDESKLKQAALFADDDKPKDDDGDKDKGENMEDGEEGLNVGSVVKAIKSGKISIADMDAILEAIQSQGADKAPEEQEPAPAAAPGAESMKNQPAMTEKMAALAGEVAGLKAKDAARDDADVLKGDVAKAMQRFSARPMGDLEKLEDGFTTFHKEHGPKAFAAYTDSLAKTVGTLPEGDEDNRSTGAGKVPEVAMKYRDKGTGAMDRAARAARNWKALQGSGMSLSEEKYVEIQMNKPEEISA